MDNLDTLFLSRLQFAFTIMFHYIYPPLSIGLGLIIVIIEGLYLKTRAPLYLMMAKFWVKIFALTFALGVATGIVMEFEFGTNWATYSRFVGDVFGSALAAEGVFAFFLESGFLALLLFGWDKVGPRLHFFSALMVALGAHFSAIWITVAGSWMHTPAGYKLVTHNGVIRAEITDFWAMVYNPSSVERIFHVYMGCWQAGAWLVISVSAFYLLKKIHMEFAQRSLKIGLIVALTASLLQLVSGHDSAVGVSKNQPAKFAAFEAHYPASAPADMYLMGWVDEKEQTVKGGIKLPGMLSWLTHGDASKPITGLNAFDPMDRPPVNLTFQAYHIMIAIGMALIGLSLLGCFLLFTRKLYHNQFVLRLMVLAVLGPQIANQAGWMAAEVGRQPWIVQGLLRTKDAFSHNVQPSHVLFSLILFTFIYVLLFVLFIFLLDQKIRMGPEVHGAKTTDRADL